MTARACFVAIGALLLIGGCGASDDAASPPETRATVEATTTRAPRAENPSIPCAAVRDAARAASAAYYANNSEFPTTFRQLTAKPHPVLELGETTLVDNTTVSGRTWTLTMSGDGTAAPELVCRDAS